MSDPVTNVEIEDVLSSIRRLVSNGQSERRSEEKVKPRNEPEIEVSRLVLTPSLRVDGSPREPAVVEKEEHPTFDATAIDRMPFWDEVAEAEAQPEAEAEVEPEVESELGADATVEAEGEVELDAASEPETNPYESETDEAAPEGLEAEQSEDQVPLDPETDVLSDVQSGLGQQAAEFETLVAERDDQWEPDGASGDDYAGGPVSALKWPEAKEPSDEDETSVDPDWAEADDLASERQTQDWKAADEAQERAVNASDPDHGESLLLDDAILDEDALRDLVAEIVRQELQGALGERITRNVRKLVRREIHRALTSQDFD
ncbi:hypothetical protein [Roseovarius sp.]|uniref:hypothetical protein n=1 Tax=Roseovarius sp. TaxID=1486281 RepID=UPI003A97DFB6